MLRRSLCLLRNFKEYHEWHLHEPLLINYEGWRVLDEPKVDNRNLNWLKDFGGNVRNLDPIIDDPRLTHQQRVCRLYHWALKEFQGYIAQGNQQKFNIGYKTVRNRFEKYRYVTDPAMCDMMVRESQKYLRELCNQNFFRRMATSPNMNYQGTFLLFHPDNSLNYDHWAGIEVMWYQDAKLHRYTGHHPLYSTTGEMSERYGDACEPRKGVALFQWLFFGLFWFAAIYKNLGCWYWEVDDPSYTQYVEKFQYNTRQAIQAEERTLRGEYDTPVLNFDWNLILGKVPRSIGYLRGGETE